MIQLSVYISIYQHNSRFGLESFTSTTLSKQQKKDHDEHIIHFMIEIIK